VGVRVGVVYLRNKRALRSRLRNLNLRSHYDFLKFVGVKVGVVNFLTIGIDKNNAFSLKFVF